MERTQVHNIQICVGDGYDAEFSKFLQEHSVSMEPSGNADEAQAEGQRFAHFLAEFCDPSWLKGLSDALPAQRFPYCTVLGFADGKPHWITNFPVETMPHGTSLQEEIETKIAPLLRREYDSLLVIGVGTELDRETGIPYSWVWRLTPQKPVLAYDWEREQIQ